MISSSPKSSDQAKHLWSRACFGLSPFIEKKRPAEIFNNNPVASLDVVSTPEKKVPMMEGDRKEFRKKKMEENKQTLRQLIIAWTEQMRTSADPLREKMTLFWHDHFASQNSEPFLLQQQNNLIRANALEGFAHLLMGISKDPVMLKFLNNQQNVKGHPNENFAREVMELFTLGRGYYTENDIKEAARAFTGWSSQNNQFFFREKQHDFDLKTFRGATKKFSGEDILSNILEDKQTAKFIAKKIISFFVSPQVDDQKVNECAEVFFKSDYNIQKLLKAIFSSDWFYDKQFAGTHIKTPIELLIGIQVQTGAKFNDPESLVFLQRAMRQQLFFPPSVAGWPKDKQWIDSASLAFRMTLPEKILNKAEIKFRPKDDGDANEVKEKKKTKDLSMDVNWEKLSQKFSGTATDVYDKAENHLLSNPTSKQNKELILKYAAQSKSEIEHLRLIFVGLMALPEYQLC